MRKNAALKRWKDEDNAKDIQKQSKCNPNAIQSKVKYSKVKESNIKEIYKEKIFFAYASNESDLLLALQDFEKMRNKIKSPMTERAKQKLLTELDKLSSDTKTKIKILEQSILHNWKSVYVIKNEPTGGIKEYE